VTPPLISVIIVSYRTRELTLRGLAALRATNSAVPHEIILVDNASDDCSAAAVATSFPDVRVVRLADNVGFARAVNAGAALARGQWLMLMNPDTEPVGDVLSAFVEFALANASHQVYAGRTLDAEGADDGRSCFALPTMWGLFCFATGLSTAFRRSRWFNPDELPGVDRSTAALIPAASGCLLLLDRALFTRLGGFAEDYFMYGEDADLCARAAEDGARPVLVPAAQVIHVNGASSTTENKVIMLFRGKCTYLRLRWSRPRAFAGRTLLAAGVALRALGARVTGRAAFWRAAWAQRATWLAGWPPADQLPPVEVVATTVAALPGRSSVRR
jgi:N-acetylglucosaminyl-diphospho-decaprenol L-rhamnosyltransferase